LGRNREQSRILAGIGWTGTALVKAFQYGFRTVVEPRKKGDKTFKNGLGQFDFRDTHSRKLGAQFQAATADPA